MITRMGVAGVYVLDHDEAKRFFIDKLGFAERFDLKMDNGMRWLTVGPPADPYFQLSLTVPGPPMHDAETAAAIRALLAKGALSGGAWNTDDCRATYAEYTARGVEFVQEPHEVPYGVEAVFRDPWGNWYSLNEVPASAFDTEEMSRHYERGDSA
ncbi:VOC family protein [Streptomonospora nanhaiensis]|uniref:Catechol 2,3-dioxygenase-like lactoylglutathione lyase family enzyme n=1 Tax=Streptomonospora nanhaiensis TaxID=1323731 RepID=A0A853BHZ7_9ACTN|nr:VOC family protein [Streptomonospora nanhaiensis]MBV2366404.1 VOC family protein [Streptomonospora nanhaiensis]MBX9391731.1 VOC family protein [Streptomonospora nanhaiensis]NYI94222.1 catechol 2,3-dioxygenase-like lactoylglutathione lyase family enzyme [Streptomonospora nanhaiensis]